MEHDYIIVGAGSAGCVLAGRLAMTGAGVLLVEAGPRDGAVLTEMPGAAWVHFSRPRFNWAFRTVPQAELGGRRDFIAAGRVVGGSSSINTMFWMRGHRHDFDAWGRVAPGWSYSACLPYFKRSEAFSGDARFRGQNGPVRVTQARPHGPVQEGFLQAVQAAGHGFTADPNGAEQRGAFVAQQTIHGGRRWSAARAYLRGRDLDGLTVLTGARATRVVIEGGRAIGVEIAGRLHRAAREVIVSSGALRSPQLLMLSGIGPADHLRAIGVPVVHDLPGVGQSLQDHIEIQLTFVLKDPVSHSRHLRPDRALAALAQWAVFKTGPCATTGFDVGAMIATRSSVPDVQAYLYPALTDGTAPRRDLHGFGLGIGCNAARGRGEVRLASADPAADPAVDPRYLSEPDDLRALVDGVQVARAIAASDGLSGLVARELDPVTRDRVEIEAWVRRTMIGIWHPAGTCRMGRDPMAVTDPNGCVHGIEGLRICDASLFPTIPNANLNAPVIMAAERIADAILGRPFLPPETISEHDP
jgi:choline dehydrogenase